MAAKISMAARLAGLFSLGLGIIAAAGCQAKQVPVEQARLSKLAIVYGRYISQHKGKTPPNEMELKKFIRTIEPDADLEEMFVSPRDSEPYVVRYNISSGVPGAATVTAHERTGKDGKRMVAFTTGEVRAVDDAEFQQLVAK